MDNGLTVWLERLDLFSLLRVFTLVFGNRVSRVNYIEAGPSASNLAALLIGSDKIEKLEYSLADMEDGGVSLGLRFQFELPDTSRKAVDRIKDSGIYREAAGILPAEKIDIFLEKKIGEEISSMVRLALVAKWHISRRRDQGTDMVLTAYSALSKEAASILENEKGIKFGFYRVIKARNPLKSLLGKRSFLKDIVLGPIDPGFSDPRLAVHYAEGIDTRTRSDIFWYPGSGVDARKVLFYLDSNKRFKAPVPLSVCKKIEDEGIGWLGLQDGVVETAGGRENRKRWRPSGAAGKTPALIMRARDPLDRWLRAVLSLLINEVEAWRAFYEAFNIKAVLDLGVQTTEAITQNMALDKVGGVRIGIQRSTISMTEYLPFMRDNANHVFFAWGDDVKNHKNTSKAIEYFVIAGYPFDTAFDDAASRCDFRAKLEKNKFVIAVFDNVFRRDLHFSEKMMTSFYSAFLNWLKEDDGIVIVMKEKNPAFFEKLSGVKHLFAEAASTGRLIRMENAKGRFPVDASCGADMSVGIGISSAITEAVIAGGRGIQCDLPKHKDNSAYAWGYRKVVFDDLDELIRALKAYKQDSSQVPDLGDWSSYIDKLDPFRDRRSGERIGSYIRWLLEGFDAGKGRDHALAHANGLYKERWGADKIMEMRCSHV